MLQINETLPLPANRRHLFRIRFWQNGIIKKDVSVFIELNIVSHGTPEFTGRDTFGIQETIELIVAPLLRMSGNQLRLCEVLKPETNKNWQ